VADEAPAGGARLISRIGGAEAEALWPFYRDWMPSGWGEATFRAGARAPEARIWVLGPATAEGECRAAPLAGFLIARQVLGELHIDAVAVDPSRRRGGFGRRLLRAALAEAPALGIDRALLELRAGNEAARGLYESAGFVVEGVRPRYYEGREDAVLMGRSVPG